MSFKVGDKVRVKDDAKLHEISLHRCDFKSPIGVIQSSDCIGARRARVYFEDIDDSWVFIKDMLELVEEEPSKMIIFSPAQVRSAAEFLEENNTYMNKPAEYFEQLILDYIKKHAFSDSTFVGTAGFYVMFSEVTDQLVQVNVLVSPDVALNSEYVEAELKYNRLVVEY